MSFVLPLRFIYAAAYIILNAFFLLSGALAQDSRKDDEQRLSYKLQPMDLVKIQVFQEPDLDRELRVSRDRTIALPLIGTIDLRNRSVHETEKLTHKLISP
jgi:polysaccharide export outer membrane protein